MTKAEFQNHPVFQKTDQLFNRLNENDVMEKIELEKLDFFLTAVQFLKDRLKVTLPTLLPVAELNSVSYEFENALAQINAYIGNDNIGHITNAVNNINSGLNYIRNFPIPYAKGDLDFAKSVVQFQQTVEEKLNQTEKKKEELDTKVAELTLDLENKQAALNELETKIDSKGNEIETLTSSYQSKFDASNTAFTEQVADDRISFRAEIDLDREKIKNDTDEIISDLKRKLNDANKLVNVIGNIGVTGNYQIIANEHKKTADDWRKIAVLFMCMLSGLLVFSIWKIGDINYDWHKAIIRIVASAILIYPATYASRESSKHRKIENLNRKLELELSSISPFIEILDDAKKQEIKVKLVEKYFGNNTVIETREDRSDNISANMLETIVKLVTNITKK